MVALALSSSLLEQQKEQQVQRGPSHSSVTPLLTWRPDAGTVTATKIFWDLLGRIGCKVLGLGDVLIFMSSL